MKSIILSLLLMIGMGQTDIDSPNDYPQSSNPKIETEVAFSKKAEAEPICANLNVLIYHHIQEEKVAKKLKQTGLSVSPDWFEKHLKYLKEEGYTAIGMEDLVSFIELEKDLPDKAVMITLDDAYEDNYLFAFPILQKHNVPATIFTPTGLVNIMGYLTWDEITEMSKSGLVYFGNHTWSHHSSIGEPGVLDKEIRLADSELTARGLNKLRVFAYPYGKPSDEVESLLKTYGYSLAFTTKRGNEICTDENYGLPRVSVGNAPLSKYGL